MKLPKQGTVSLAIYKLMDKSVNEKQQIEVPKVKNKFGEIVNGSTILVYVHKLNKDHFGSFKFYTRTINDKLFIGTIEHLKNE